MITKGITIFILFSIRLLQVTPDLPEVQKLHRKNYILGKLNHNMDYIDQFNHDSKKQRTSF